MIWESARWANEGGAWIFYEGHWRVPEVRPEVVYEPPPPHPATAPEPPNLMQVVSPMVLTHYGLAALIVLLALSHGAGRTGVIVATLVAVMLLNLLTMAFVRPLLRTVGPVLWAIGCVLGLLQLALSVQIILTALRGLGVLTGHA